MAFKGGHINVSTLPNVKTDIMDKTKLTREEALRRWKTSKETKRKMVEKLENLVRNSCLERTGKEPNGVEVW